MRFFLVHLFVFLAGFGAEAESLEIAPLSSPVIDEVGLISQANRDLLQRRIEKLHQTGLAQVQVYVIKSLAGLTIEEASIKIVDQWKLGSESIDNGLLVLVAPKERRVRIEVGQGLEGSITDAFAKRITSTVVIPSIKEGRLPDGLIATIDIIEQILGKDLPAGAKGSSPKKKGTNWVVLLFIGLWVLISVFGRRGPTGFRRGGSGLPFYGGGFGGGGSSSGGWSGGGGGFSGGGASDSW